MERYAVPIEITGTRPVMTWREHWERVLIRWSAEQWL
jgi:hypothetical protein